MAIRLLGAPLHSQYNLGRFGVVWLDLMRFEYPKFGTIVVDGEQYDHDVIVADGVVRPRDKGPSRHLKRQYGHTPLSEDEDIPWSSPRLVIGSGFSGRLPVLPGLKQEAARQDVDVLVMPTAEAVELLNTTDESETSAILHVTC